jgi:hypothetical protein
MTESGHASTAVQVSKSPFHCEAGQTGGFPRQSLFEQAWAVRYSLDCAARHAMEDLVSRTRPALEQRAARRVFAGHARHLGNGADVAMASRFRGKGKPGGGRLIGKRVALRSPNRKRARRRPGGPPGERFAGASPARAQAAAAAALPASVAAFTSLRRPVLTS